MIYQIDYFGFVYEWTDSGTGIKYVGSHHGPTDDTYKGSNTRFRRAIRKRPDDFTRKILEYSTINAPGHTLAIEQKWLDSIPNIKDNDGYYNQKNEACGGWSFITNDHIRRRSLTLKEKHSKYGLTEKEAKSYRRKIEKRLDRIADIGFTEKEEQQHNLFSTQIKVIFPDNTNKIFLSITKCSKELGIDARYGTVATMKKGSYKGYKIYRIKEPTVPCYKDKNELI